MKKTPIAAAAASAAGAPVTDLDVSDHQEAGKSGNSELDDLQGLADQVDSDAGSGTVINGEVAPPAIDYNLEAAKMVDTFAALMVGYCPATAEVWSNEKKGTITAALAPVLQKYGVTMDALPCELVLIFVAGPALYVSAKMVAAQMKQQQLEKAQAKASAPAAQKKPGETGTAPDVARHAQTALYPS